MSNISLHSFGSVVRNHLSCSADITELDFHGDVLGDLSFTSGGPVPTFKGRYFGALTDPDGYFSGSAAGSYINIP